MSAIWTGEERRRHKRINKELVLNYKIVGSVENYDKFYTAKIKNLCAGGVLILTDDKIQKYILLEIKIFLDRETVLAKGKVTRAEKIDGNYSIAIRFLSFCNTSCDKIKKFVDYFNG